jgi:hypothetical protein
MMVKSNFMNLTGKWVLLLAGTLAIGWNRDDSIESTVSPVEISLTHLAAGNLLELDKVIVNPHGEPVTITNLAYYLSHFALLDASDRLVTLTPEFYLVSEKNPASKKIRFFAPQGTYKALQILIGVDSTRNVSGIQSGALDPANGMFWSWNTGYIFAKLEGKSVVSAAPLQNVTYHIGGFKKQDGSLQTVTLNFPEQLVVKKARNPVIAMNAEVNAWFSGKHSIKIAEHPFCMDPGDLARKISENYTGMFSITSVTN